MIDHAGHSRDVINLLGAVLDLLASPFHILAKAMGGIAPHAHHGQQKRKREENEGDFHGRSGAGIKADVPKSLALQPL